MKRITLKDIADKVNVSKTAVSKVLNGRNIRISEDKRLRIHKVASQLGYRPNIIARSLQNQATETIGIVIPDMTTLFYPEIISSIEQSLASKGYKTIICNTRDDSAREKSQLEDLLSRQVDGFVIAPAPGNTNLDLFRQIHESSRPFLMIDRYFPGEPYHYVVSDNREGAKSGVKWAASQGVRRIAYIGGEARNQAVDDRLAGVEEASAAHNIAFADKDVFLHKPESPQISESYDKILRKADTGLCVFLESNQFLMGVLGACRQLDLLVPNDIKVVGFDPFEPEIASPEDFETLRVLRGPIPILKQSIVQMGVKASEYLLRSFLDKTTEELQIMLPVKLIKPKGQRNV